MACDSTSGGEDQRMADADGLFICELRWGPSESHVPDSILDELEIQLMAYEDDGDTLEFSLDATNALIQVDSLEYGGYDVYFSLHDYGIHLTFSLDRRNKIFKQVVYLDTLIPELPSSSSVYFSSELLSSSSVMSSLSQGTTHYSSKVDVMLDKPEIEGVLVHEIPGVIEFEDFVRPGVAEKYHWPYHESDGHRQDKASMNVPENTDIYGLILNYPDMGTNDSLGIEYNACLCHEDQRWSNDEESRSDARRGCYVSDNFPQDQEVTSELFGDETGPWNVCLTFIAEEEELSYVVYAPQKGKYKVYLAANTGIAEDPVGDAWNSGSPGYEFAFSIYNLTRSKKYLEYSNGIVYPSSFPESGALWVHSLEQNAFSMDLSEEFPNTVLFVFHSAGKPYNVDYLRFELDNGSDIATNMEDDLDECQDEIDNDGDGQIDCLDPDCLAWEFCSSIQDSVANRFNEIEGIHSIPGVVEAEYFMNPEFILDSFWATLESSGEHETEGTLGEADCRKEVVQSFGIDLSLAGDDGSLWDVHDKLDCKEDAVLSHVVEGEKLFYALSVNNEEHFIVKSRVSSGYNATDLARNPPFTYNLKFYKADSDKELIQKLEYYILDTGEWMQYADFLPQVWKQTEVSGNCNQIILGTQELLKTDCWVKELFTDTLTLLKGNYIMEFEAEESAYNINHFEFIKL